MFKKIQIDSFKCFERFSCDLNKLTLLTGYNAAGKSTVIQTLALLKQTISANEWATAIQLNGKSVALGAIADVVNRNIGGGSFTLTLESDRWVCAWTTYSENRQRDLVAPISKVV